MRGERDRKTSKMLAVRAEKHSFLLPMVVCSTPCWCADHAHHRCYFLFSLLRLSACSRSRGRFQTCPRWRSCACRCLLDAIHTLRASPYSRVLDASAVPSRRNLYTAGQPILPRARRQRGVFQTQPIHCGPAHTPACSTPARCLPDATYTLRAGPYSRVLDASAVPSRRNLYTAGQPILPRARRQRGAFQTQPIHCGPEARAPRCEREGWFPNLISPTTFLFHGGEE